MSKVFPKTLSFPPTGKRITIYADGTCDGDHRIIELALAAMDTSSRPLAPVELTTILMWFLLRAMQEDAGAGRRAR